MQSHLLCHNSVRAQNHSGSRCATNCWFEHVSVGKISDCSIANLKPGLSLVKINAPKV